MPYDNFNLDAFSAPYKQMFMGGIQVYQSRTPDADDLQKEKIDNFIANCTTVMNSESPNKHFEMIYQHTMFAGEGALVTRKDASEYVTAETYVLHLAHAD